MPAYLALLAYALLILGLNRADGRADLLGLVLVCLAWVVCCVGLVRSRKAWGRPGPGLAVGLVAVLVLESYLSWRRALRASPEFALGGPSPELALGGASLVPFAVWIAAMLLLAPLWATPWLARRRVHLAVALSLVAGAWAILCWQADDRQRGAWFIDVTYFQTTAAEELLAGRNPYSHLYENIYHPKTELYGERILRDGKVVSFPYPPATLVWDVIGHGLGDVRWGNLLALGLGAVLLVAAARKAGLPAGHPAELAVVALLLWPATGTVLVFGWTEPTVFCAAAFCLWTLVGPPGWRRYLGVGAYLAAKQTAVLWLPALYLTGRVRGRDVVGGALVALALAVPFLLWDFRGFWAGVVDFHLASPARKDALAIPRLVYLITQRQMSVLVAFGAVAGVFALHAVVRRPSLAQATCAGLNVHAFTGVKHVHRSWLGI